eukprot:TRINITY_DN2770_c0_g1_i1.p1 TRINITY_DN2770_c0_g1~~TRINITY_DN2770_c0_g1_i1.p1  ORF type:complete len:197 (-),score=20.21 TRINITY_DN2770_c0_g1_i1:84-647(-)
MSKKVLVPIADGSEEIEAVCIIDTLRRAGAQVVVASVENHKLVTCSRRVKIEADVLINEVHHDHFDMIVLPGGMPGAEHLRDSSILRSMLEKQAHHSRWYAAICAAPNVVFNSHGLLDGKVATAYPGSHSGKLPIQDKVGDRVVVCDNCITSQGPGTSLEFALKLVEVLFSREEAEKVQRGLLVPSF